MFLTNIVWYYAFIDGDLYAWGLNHNGQLGVGCELKKVKKPIHIASLCGIPMAYIACGGSHSFALSK